MLAIKMLANLKNLFLADMGPIPLTILAPFGQLRSLNLSGNHLTNASLSILEPANNLEVKFSLSLHFSFFKENTYNFAVSVRSVAYVNTKAISHCCHVCMRRHSTKFSTRTSVISTNVFVFVSESMSVYVCICVYKRSNAIKMSRTQSTRPKLKCIPASERSTRCDLPMLSRLSTVMREDKSCTPNVHTYIYVTLLNVKIM